MGWNHGRMDVIAAVRDHLVTHFDVSDPAGASVTFLGLEPIEVLRFPAGAATSYVTLGGARHPMTDPSATIADPIRGPRAEVALTMRGLVPGVQRGLAVLAAAPAVEGIVLTDDALLDLGEPLWTGCPFTAVLLGDSRIPALELGEPYDPVRFLDATPITATEAAWVRLRGVPALRDAWREAAVDVHDPTRADSDS